MKEKPPTQPAERPTFGVTDPRTVRPTEQERLRAAWRKADAARRARTANLPVPLPWTDPDTAHRGLGPGHGGKPVKRHE